MNEPDIFAHSAIHAQRVAADYAAEALALTLECLRDAGASWQPNSERFAQLAQQRAYIAACIARSYLMRLLADA